MMNPKLLAPADLKKFDHMWYAHTHVYTEFIKRQVHIVVANLESPRYLETPLEKPLLFLQEYLMGNRINSVECAMSTDRRQIIHVHLPTKRHEVLFPRDILHFFKISGIVFDLRNLSCLVDRTVHLMT